MGRAAAQTEQNLKPKVVFLGDYVDRGEDSRAVLNCLIGLEAEFPSIQWIFLAGNHEAAMLGFLDNPLEHIAWLGFGGAETLLNYGVRPRSVWAGGRSKRPATNCSKPCPIRIYASCSNYVTATNAAIIFSSMPACVRAYRWNAKHQKICCGSATSS